MSNPSQAPKARPSPVWYLLVVLLWVGAAVVAFVTFKPFIDLLNSDITPVSNNSQVTVQTDGFTVYSRVNAADRSCTLTGADAAAIKLDSFDGDFNINTSSAPNYFALASTPKSMDSGTYTLSCSGVAPNASLGLGDRLDVKALAKRAIFGVFVPLAMGFLGLVILIVMLVKRHNSKARIRLGQTQAAAGYYGGYPASGGYPPPPGQYPAPGNYPPPPGNYPPPGSAPPPPPDGNPPA